MITTMQMREQQIVSSAVWAAYGDALGFPMELVDESGVIRRIGSPKIHKTVPWKRLVGGLTAGTWANLDAGAYSDDTQLRLATSRSIRGDGNFDVETFAKVELPVWLSYALGAGRGSKVAATSLSQRNIGWFTNFFDVKDVTYISGGGNGAAMRIQPHVWAAHNLTDATSYIGDVVRNALTTHGHPRGIAGAVVHAACLAVMLQDQAIPEPADWADLGLYIQTATKFVEADPHLSTFWLPTWESTSGQAFSAGMFKTCREWELDVEVCRRHLSLEPVQAYLAIVDAIGARSPEQRGSGLKSALLALAAAWLFRERGPNEALIAVANVLGSDTDTVASMTGALMGTIFPNEAIPGDLQDQAYIEDEARRLYQTSYGRSAQSFVYPDLLRWQAPRTQLDSIGTIGERVVVAGLGFANLLGEPYFGKKKDGAWQWARLEFGQTVLCKRRPNLTPMPDVHYPAEAGSAPRYQAPANLQTPRGRKERPAIAQVNNVRIDDLFSSKDMPQEPIQQSLPTVTTSSHDAEYTLPITSGPSISQLVDKAVRANFDPRVIGIDLLSLAQDPLGVERAIAYSSLIVKARMTRLRTGR